MTSFMGDTEHMGEFVEHTLRCFNSRDARFVGKQLSSASRRSGYGTFYVSIFVTLAGKYIVWTKIDRSDGTEFSEYNVFENIEGISKECDRCFFGDVFKRAMIDAGLDDAVDIP